MGTAASLLLFMLFILSAALFAASLFPGERGSGKNVSARASGEGSGGAPDKDTGEAPSDRRRKAGIGEALFLAGWISLLVGFLGLSGLILLRSVAIGFPALTKTYEGLLFFSWALSLTLLILSARDMFSGKAVGAPRRQMLLWGVLLVVLFIALASSPLVPDSLTPPVPALRSVWLVMHVAFSFIGEAAFALSFVAAVVYFLLPDKRDEAERIASAAVVVGYPVYTIGALLFGAIWAQYAWGRYWGWDPKEVWALVTWLVYTFYLHLRLVGKKRGALPMVVLLIGFPVALFTFLGVNALAVGLHAYN